MAEAMCVDKQSFYVFQGDSVLVPACSTRVLNISVLSLFEGLHLEASQLMNAFLYSVCKKHAMHFCFFCLPDAMHAADRLRLISYI